MGDIVATRWVSPVLVAVGLVYLLLMVWNVDDLDFILPQRFLSVDLSLPIPGGYVSLPGVSQSVSLFQFFLFAPVIVAGLHVFALRLWLVAGSYVSGFGSFDQLLAAVGLFGPPLLLLAMAEAYAPAAALRPNGDEMLGRYWLVLLHQALIVVDWLAIMVFVALARRPVVRDGLRWPADLVEAAATIVALTGLVALAMQMTEFMEFRRGGTAWNEPSAARSAMLVGATLAAPLLLVAWRGRLPAARFALRLLAAPVPQEKLADGRLGIFMQGRKIPMSIRLAAAAYIVIATVQIAHARGVDLAHREIAVRMPSASLIEAYISVRDPNQEVNGMNKAIMDHARGLNLNGWRLARANFTGAMMPKISLRGTDLEGARFDFAKMFGADLSGAKARGASFQFADFTLVAQESSVRSDAPQLTGADFTEAKLQGVIFQNADVPDDGKIDCPALGLSHPPGMTDVTLTGAFLQGAYLDGVDFTKLGDISGAHFDGVRARCAVFDCADLGAVSFRDADLRGSTFVRSWLSGEPKTSTGSLNECLAAAPPEAAN